MFKQNNLSLCAVLLLVVFCLPFMAFGEERKAKLLLPNCMTFEPRGNIATMDENKKRLTLEEGAVRYNIWVGKTTADSGTLEHLILSIRTVVLHSEAGHVTS